MSASSLCAAARLLVEYVVGVIRVGEAGRDMLGLRVVNGFQRLRSGDAVHGQVVIVLKAFHRVAGIETEVTVGGQRLVLVVGVAELGEVGLQIVYGLALGALLENAAHFLSCEAWSGSTAFSSDDLLTSQFQ